MLTETSTTVTTCRFATADAADAADATGGFLCHCAKVEEAVVSAAVNFGAVKTVEEVMAFTGAGTGCRACHCRIQRVLGGLPAKCGGRFDWCHQCGCIGAICRCEAA